MEYFVETQRFTQKWVWALVLGAAALIWYGAVQQLVLGRPWGSNPAGDRLLLVFWLLFGLLLPALFFVAGLRTEVRSDGIRIRFFPFHLRWRHWRYDAIARIEPRRYAAFREFGGVGIRLGAGGWAYIVRGDRGIQLELDYGRRVLIGTGDPDRFMAAVARARIRGPAGADDGSRDRPGL